MNHKEKIRKLTWKYFWQQKIKEILWYGAIAFILAMVPYLVGSFIAELAGGDNGYWLLDWAMGLAAIVWIGIVLFVITATLGGWISRNWEKAEKRAKKEIRRTKK